MGVRRSRTAEIDHARRTDIFHGFIALRLHHLAQATQDEAVNLQDTANAIDERESLSISLTDGNFAIDDIVQFELFRDGVDSGDTLVGAVMLFGLYFEYADA